MGRVIAGIGMWFSLGLGNRFGCFCDGWNVVDLHRSLNLRRGPTPVSDGLVGLVRKRDTALLTFPQQGSSFIYPIVDYAKVVELQL
jgi:hypothetical protein